MSFGVFYSHHALSDVVESTFPEVAVGYVEGHAKTAACQTQKRCTQDLKFRVFLKALTEVKDLDRM